MIGSKIVLVVAYYHFELNFVELELGSHCVFFLACIPVSLAPERSKPRIISLQDLSLSKSIPYFVIAGAPCFEVDMDLPSSNI